MFSRVAGFLSAALVATVPSSLGAQPTPQAPAPITRVSMEDAVRLSLDRNQALRALRLTIDEAKADEITAALKPNFNLSLGAEGFPLFSPGQINTSFLGNEISYSAGLGYLFERGGKRAKRMTVAEDTTEQTRRNVADQERQLRFQAEQAFIAALLAKSTLDLAQANLKSFSEIVEINRERVRSGDLAQGEFYKISLQKLQFQQDVSAAEVSLVQAKANLRQIMGFESVPDDFELVGDLTFDTVAVSLDVLSAQQGVKLAEDTVALQQGNRARDVSAGFDYTKTGPADLFGVSVSFDLPFRDRNQGNIAHAEVAVRQAQETEFATRFTAVTDVVNAYASFDTSQRIVTLYRSGYLDQARKSLDISTYVFQHGAGTILDLLDAEQTYRGTELAYRQALATYMTSLKQINFAVGKQVIP
jgi:outer membrane protein, heavy metal efflux system